MMQKNKYIDKEVKLPEETILRHFLPIEWSLLPYIDSLFFIDRYFRNNQYFDINSQELKVYSFNNLQAVFHGILKRFLQSPIDKHYHKFIKIKLHRYLIFREIFLNNHYSVNPQMVFNCLNQTGLIIKMYQDVKELRKRFNLSLGKEKITIPNKFNRHDFKNLGWQYSAIDFLQKASKKKLANLIDCFLVHGSFATKDFLKQWSDLDTLMILNEKVFKNINILNYTKRVIEETASVCYKIDPLNHHTFFFLTDFDLNYYPAHFFPPVLYNYSVLLSDNPNIDIYLRPDRYQKIQIMSDFVNHFRNKILNGSYSQNMVRWKEDLSMLMLWPSLLLQARNIYVYKKDSFTRVKESFPEIDFKIINQASQIRENWSCPNLLKYYPNFLFTSLPIRFNQIIVNQYRKYLMNLPLKQTSHQIETISQTALSFLEKSFILILKDLKDKKV